METSQLVNIAIQEQQQEGLFDLTNFESFNIAKREDDPEEKFDQSNVSKRLNFNTIKTEDESITNQETSYFSSGKKPNLVSGHKHKLI